MMWVSIHAKQNNKVHTNKLRNDIDLDLCFNSIVCLLFILCNLLFLLFKYLYSEVYPVYYSITLIMKQLFYSNYDNVRISLIKSVLSLLLFKNLFSEISDIVVLYQPLFRKHTFTKGKGNIIKKGHTSPGRSLGSTNDTQTIDHRDQRRAVHKRHNITKPRKKNICNL